MAIYTFHCPDHGDFEEMRSVKAFSRITKCPKCRRASRLKMSLPGKHIVDFIPGWNGGAGKYFDRKVDRDTWMRENNMERC